MLNLVLHTLVHIVAQNSSNTVRCSLLSGSDPYFVHLHTSLHFVFCADHCHFYLCIRMKLRSDYTTLFGPADTLFSYSTGAYFVCVV